MSLDTTGKWCPVPIVELGKAITKVEPGQLIELIATDPGVETDVPAWCKATRHTLVSLERAGRSYRALVRRAEKETSP